jgi:hypothetical protein
MYVAFKVNNNKSVIWPSLYTNQISTYGHMSHRSKSLENPSGLVINKMYGIVEIESEGEMIMIIMNTIVYLSLNMITRFAKSCSNEIIQSYLKECISKSTRRAINDLNESNCGFEPLDIMTEKFAKRQWPVSMFSPSDWKELQMADGNHANWMINIVAKQIKLDNDAKINGTEPEQPYDFLADVESTDLDLELQTSIDTGNIKIFAALALKLDNTYTMDQYLMWLASTDIPQKHCKLATSLGARYMNTHHGGLSTRKGKELMQLYERAQVDVSSHCETLRNLHDMQMINEVMVYACTMLTRPMYLLLLRETDIMDMIKIYKNDHPLYTDMVGVAMSYAMYYATRYEFDTTRFNASIEDPFVWTIDMAASFSEFDCAPGSHPFIQMGLKHFKLFSPWTIVDFNRRIVTSEEAIARMNITAIRDWEKLDFSKIIPWRTMNLTFTGSRMGTCGAILPQEAEYDNFNEYIKNYVGTCEELIDIAITEFDRMGTENIEVAIDGEHSNSAIASIFHDCKKMSDIDIQFCGKLECFDSTAKRLVMRLRSYGIVFMVKRKKFGDSYSWTIFADFLRYPIDLFCATRSSIRLITGFMTGYPRIYYDGNAVIVTSYYVCARVTGINIWYERMMMNDPIMMMVKSIVQEQASLLINFRESRMLEQWMEKHGMVDNLVFGNVSTKHAIFWNNKKNAPVSMDSERHWLQTEWMTPYSNSVIRIWDGKYLVIPDNHIFDRYWNDLIEIQSKRRYK